MTMERRVQDSAVESNQESRDASGESGAAREGNSGGPRTFQPGARPGQGQYPATPRKVRHGIKLVAKDGAIPRNDASGHWLDVFERITTTGEREQGRQYAIMGQTRTLEIRPGEIVASVQGVRSRAYSTKIHIEPLREEHWDALISAMAKEPVNLVKLTAGELPSGIRQLARQAGVPFFLRGLEDLKFSCTCGRPLPCRHISAVADLVAEELARKPLTMFRLRGMDSEVVIERLRQALAIRTRGEATAHVDPMIPESREEAEPLEDCLDHFWRPGVGMLHFQDRPAHPHVPHALLRRLGPSPLEGKFPFVGLLASIYDTVRDHTKVIQASVDDQPLPDDLPSDELADADDPSAD